VDERIATVVQGDPADALLGDAPGELRVGVVLRALGGVHDRHHQDAGGRARVAEDEAHDVASLLGRAVVRGEHLEGKAFGGRRLYRLLGHRAVVLVAVVEDEQGQLAVQGSTPGAAV